MSMPRLNEIDDQCMAPQLNDLPESLRKVKGIPRTS